MKTFYILIVQRMQNAIVQNTFVRNETIAETILETTTVRVFLGIFILVISRFYNHKRYECSIISRSIRSIDIHPIETMFASYYKREYIYSSIVSHRHSTIFG